VPKKEIRPVREILLERGHLIIAPIIIIFTLIRGFTATRAGLYGLIAAATASILRKNTRINLSKMLDAFRSAAKSIVPVASACACAGIIIGVVRFTGLGLKFSSAVISLSGGNLFLALTFTMLSCIILGMGLPTTASYVIQAALAAPALIQMGVLPIQAHLFVFYFSCMAPITPPVALAAYAAAPICEGDPTKIGFIAWKLGLSAFIIPYMFIYGPGLVFIGSGTEIAGAIVSATVGVFALAFSVIGWAKCTINPISRIFLFFGACMLMIQGLVTDLIGVVVLIAATVFHLFRINKKETSKISVQDRREQDRTGNSCE
jgi:TRAP transporter 4TM/12TM fusion protein